MKFSRALVVAVTVTALTGCALLPVADDPTPGIVPTVTPTPTATQARETGLTPPAQVFGGDCAALFTTQEISELVGGEMEAVHSSPQLSGVDLRGGISCTWRDDAAALVAVVVLPEGAATYDPPSGCHETADGWEAGCAVEATQNGIRLSGAVFANDLDASAEQAGLLQLFAERADRANAAPIPLPADGAWGWPVDCAGLVATADFSSVPGFEGAVEGWDVGFGDGYRVPAEWALMANDFDECSVNSGDLTVTFRAMGGMRWAETEILALPGATTTVFDGMDTVVLSPAAYGDKTRVDVFTGPNWLSFSVRYAKNAEVLARVLVAALDATAVN